MDQEARTRAAEVIGAALGRLTTDALAGMEAALPWFSALEAHHRASIGSVAHGGISGLIGWLREPVGETAAPVDPFVAAPRALVRVITLQQTVAMVRTTIEVVEAQVDDLFEDDLRADVRLEVSLYAREVAFAAADVYARAAEARGALDARLEALVVDSVIRGEDDETVRSRASAVGWTARGDVAVVLGSAPRPHQDDRVAETAGVVEAVRRAARAAGLESLSSVQGDRLVVVLGDVDDLDKAGASVVDAFGDGPVVVGPRVADLTGAHRSARSATAAWRSATAWADAPRPVQADDLLVERSLAGDGHARHALAHEVYLPLARADAPLLLTLTAFFAHGSSIEATARALFVHPNTVRYRLGKVTSVTGLRPGDARESYTLQVALTLGRLLEPGP